MGFFTSDSILESSFVERLESLLSSYGQPVVNGITGAIKFTANDPSLAINTAYTMASEFFYDNPYTCFLAAVSAMTLVQLYRKNGFHLNLGRVYGGIETFLGGVSFDVHLGRNNSQALINQFHFSSLETQISGLQRKMTTAFNVAKNTSTKISDLFPPLEGLTIKTEQIYQMTRNQRSHSAPSLPISAPVISEQTEPGSSQSDGHQSRLSPN